MLITTLRLSVIFLKTLYTVYGSHRQHNVCSVWVQGRNILLVLSLERVLLHAVVSPTEWA